MTSCAHLSTTISSNFLWDKTFCNFQVYQVALTTLENPNNQNLHSEQGNNRWDSETATLTKSMGVLASIAELKWMKL